MGGVQDLALALVAREAPARGERVGGGAPRVAVLVWVSTRSEVTRL